MTDRDMDNLRNAVDGRPPSDITICFDMDGVISENNSGDYENAPPIKLGIDNVNQAYSFGYRIIIYTARFGQRFPDQQYQKGYELTINWLRKNGVKFHELRMGKPHYDLIVDDKGCRVDGNNSASWSWFWSLVEDLHKKNKYGQLLKP